MASNKGGLNLPIRVNDKEVKRSFKDINSEYYKLRNSVNKLEEGTEEWVKANKRLAAVEADRKGMIKRQREFREELVKTKDATEDNTSALEDFSGSFGDLFDSLRSGDLMGVQTAFVGIRAGIVGATKAAWAFIATPIGAAIMALVGVGLAAREWNKYNKEAAEANLITQQVTRLSGEALDQARIRSKSIEKTFGIEFKQNLESAKVLVNAFGISYEEAFDRIEDGLIRGGKENSEFLDSIKEYPRLFAQAGFTVEDFQRILNTGIDMGIYSDKLPDAIKEFSLSIMEGTTASRDALENAFGKQFTDELFTNIENGSLTSKDALQLVASEAETIGLNAQQAQQLTADLFRGAGEDAGGALVIFEAVNTALSEQARELTPLETNLKRVADAHRRLEEAQNDALKSDQYAAFVNNIEVAWINFKAGFFEGLNSVMEGLVSADTAFRRFVFQSVQYVKDAFTIGADADWEKLGKKFDEQQAKLEAAAREQKKLEKEKKEEEDPTGPTGGEAERKRREAEEKAAAARIERAKEAAEAEKKRIEEIAALEAEYQKKKEERLANSAVKEAELDMQRALKKAEALGAEQALLDQIRAEHQIKIDEERTLEEEEELQRMRDFEARKLELENELRLARAESEAEREEIKKEIQLEKEQAEYEKKMAQFEEEMARLELTEEEKNQVLASLKEAHENTLLGIQKKYTDKKIEDERRLNEEKKKIWNDSLDAAINLAGAESKVGQALLIAKQIMAAKEMAVELGLFQNKATLLAAGATAHIAEGEAKTAAAAPFPANIPLIIGFAAQVAGIVSAIRNAAKAKGKVKTSFARGGETTPFGMGYRDETGEEVAGVVHTEEYVIPKFVRKDPEVPQIIDYLEQKRQQKLRGFATGGDTGGASPSTPSTQSAGTSFARVESLLQDILEVTAENNVILFGAEAELKRQELQKKLQKIKDRSKLKP